MKLPYSTIVSAAFFHSLHATTVDNDRELIGIGMFEEEVQEAQANYNIPNDDLGAFDYNGLADSDTVHVLIQKKEDAPDDAVFPMSFNTEMEVKSHGIAGGTMTKGAYESMVNDSESNFYVELDEEKLYALEEDHITNLRRRLAENTPYGINMVLQDKNFWSNLGDPSGTIKVCVADTGYDITHEDVPKGNDVTGTSNPEYTSDRWDRDPHGHGTHCSGTVAAIGNNDKGVVGVIPNNAGGKFQLVIANSLRGSGSGSNSGVIKGVETCVDNGAKVISLSLGGYYYSSISEKFYEDLYEDKDILFIAAAGNGGNTRKLYPSSYPALMSVAAIDSNKNKASFSTYNDQVEISAPGVLVESSLPKAKYSTGYGRWSGTSMATPHVAGVAGLLWMHFPECKNYQIRNVMLATAEDLRTNGCDVYTGYGLVQAKAAYELLSKGNCGGNLGKTDGTTGGCSQLTVEPTSAPNPVPSSAPNSPPTSPYPTHTAPTMYPTHKAPTMYPTEVPPTPYPTGKTCAVKDEACKRHSDCCKKKCNRIKGHCRQ